MGCGTGVVAVAAARLGAKVSAQDLSPALIERARANVALAGVEVDLSESDVEALPYPDESFDVVLSQFGHMFAPRPQVAIRRDAAGVKAWRDSGVFHMAAGSIRGPSV